jgi:hypothetical protein
MEETSGMHHHEFHEKEEFQERLFKPARAVS